MSHAVALCLVVEEGPVLLEDVDLLLELRGNGLQLSLELEDVFADLLEQGALDDGPLPTVGGQSGGSTPARLFEGVED